MNSISASRALQPGDIWAGRYEIVAKIGSGATSTVYRARDTLDGSVVAIKVLRPHLAEDARLVANFKREASVAKLVTHPNVVRIYDIGEQDGVLFLVMEYVEGRTLSELLSERGQFHPGELMPLFNQFVAALSAVHSGGVIHRDIKPTNIVVLPGGQVKLMDFGVARPADGKVTVGPPIGTPAYMAPEHLAGKVPTPAADVFSTGAMLYELLSGRRPFTGASLAERLTKRAKPIDSVVGGLPPILCVIVDKCLRLDPAERFATGSDLAASLRLMAPIPVPPPEPKPTREVDTLPPQPSPLTAGSEAAPPAPEAKEEPVPPKSPEPPPPAPEPVPDEVKEPEPAPPPPPPPPPKPVVVKRIEVPPPPPPPKPVAMEPIAPPPSPSPAPPPPAAPKRPAPATRTAPRRALRSLFTEGPPEITTMLPVLTRLAKAVQTIHSQSRCTQDLNPERIGIATDGSIEIEALPEEQATATVMGSNPRYSSPEYFTDRGLPTLRDRNLAEVYVLGFILYEALQGQREFRKQFSTVMQEPGDVGWMTWHADRTLRPTPLHEIRSDCPRALSDLVEQMTEKQPENRPAGLSAILDQLAAISERLEGTVRTDDVTLPEPAMGVSNSGLPKPLLWAAAAVGVLIVLEVIWLVFGR